MRTIIKFFDIIIDWINRLIEWYRSSKTVSENILRGLAVVLALILVFFSLSLYGVILLLFPKITTFFIILIVCMFLATIFATLILKEVKQIFWKRASFCSGFCALTFVSLFLAGFVFVLIPPNVGRYVFPVKARLPLGDADGMVIDGNGKIYIALPFYQRIQVYDIGGNFIKGLFVDSHAGTFNVWIEDGLLHVAVSRTKKHLVMNLDCQIIRSSEIKSFEEWESLWKKGSMDQHKDSSGNIYEFHRSRWFPKVTKTAPSSSTIVLISDPFYLWLLKAPFPAWIFVLLGVIIIPIVKIMKLNYDHRKMIA